MIQVEPRPRLQHNKLPPPRLDLEVAVLSVPQPLDIVSVQAGTVHDNVAFELAPLFCCQRPAVRTTLGANDVLAGHNSCASPLRRLGVAD